VSPHIVAQLLIVNGKDEGKEEIILGMRNAECGMGNGEMGIGNGEWGMERWEWENIFIGTPVSLTLK
jgi:hypothetical protein